MVSTYSFYGSDTSFKNILDQIQTRLETSSQGKVSLIKNTYGTIIECSNTTIYIEVNYPTPERNIEYYQIGLKRMDVTVSYDAQDKEINTFVDRLNKVFTPEEEAHLDEYTPWLKGLVNPEFFDKKILSNSLVIFREHSLISVYNIYKLFNAMGLKPENTVYYSKGDRCRNIHRIEESFKAKGYGVFVLSPFESISPTGKSEDEKITPDAAERTYHELKPYFEKARKENLKVVVFDDGGLMVTTVIDLFACDYGDLIYGYIETTKGGMHAINSRCDLNVTVINLADCVIKNLLNAVIGHSIVQRLREMIPHVGLRGQSVVVVGYGTLGRAIAKDLRRLGMSIYVCEKSNDKVFEALTDGFAVAKDAAYLIREFKPILIMGCTGLDALNYENLSQITRDTYVATVSSNEIKQAYPDFDKYCELDFVENYARTYTLPNKTKLIILGNGASLNLYNGEGANHSEYQAFLAAMIETIGYAILNGPVSGKNGLDTEIADKIINEANILDKYLVLSNSLLGQHSVKKQK